MRPFQLALLALTLVVVSSLLGCVHIRQTSRVKDGWVNLFNGKNLDGWAEHSGKAKYTVEAGVLTGESVSDSGNSFLCTTQTFENFEFELE